MARAKKTTNTDNGEPVIIRGSHSTRTEYPDGRVEFVTHWDELVRDVQAALASVSPGVIEEVKVKKTRAKKAKA